MPTRFAPPPAAIPIAPQLLSTRLTLAQLDGPDVIALYNALRTYESDFDKAQSSLRTIASAWLLATVGGLGLVLQMQGTILGFDPWLATGLRQSLLLFSTLGLVSLWYLDQRVYQQLLHASFAYGCWLEFCRSTVLPPARIYMYLLNRDITARLGLFYRAPLWCLLIVAIANAVLQFAIASPHDISLILVRPFARHSWFLWVLAGHIATLLVAIGRSRDWPQLTPELPPAVVAARQGLAAGGPLPPDFLMPATATPSA